MKEKSHKGQRHKGCGLCNWEKRAGNSELRRPIRDRRQFARAQDVAPTRPHSPPTQGTATKPVGADQAWFWTDAWQRGERRASQNIRGGRVSPARSAGEFLDSLE